MNILPISAALSPISGNSSSTSIRNTQRDTDIYKNKLKIHNKETAVSAQDLSYVNLKNLTITIILLQTIYNTSKEDQNSYI